MMSREDILRELGDARTELSNINQQLAASTTALTYERQANEKLKVCEGVQMYDYMKVSVVRKSRKAGGSVQQTCNPVCTLNVTDSFEKSRGSSRVCICTHTFVLGHRTT